MTRWLAVMVVAGLGIASVAQADGKPCSYAWKPFADGSVSCQDGQQFRCADGAWQNVGTACADADPGDAGVAVRPAVNEPTVKDPRDPSFNQPAAPRVEQPPAP
jgi:hypothetical protein